MLALKKGRKEIERKRRRMMIKRRRKRWIWRWLRENKMNVNLWQGLKKKGWGCMMKNKWESKWHKWNKNIERKWVIKEEGIK
jgi:hypothetical protein